MRSKNLCTAAKRKAGSGDETGRIRKRSQAALQEESWLSEHRCTLADSSSLFSPWQINSLHRRLTENSPWLSSASGPAPTQTAATRLAAGAQHCNAGEVRHQPPHHPFPTKTTFFSPLTALHHHLLLFLPQQCFSLLK